MYFTYGINSVRFTALGGHTERFLQACAQQELPLGSIQAVPGGFTAWVPARYYRRLHPLARRQRVRLRVQKRRGIGFRLRRYRGRWGLPLGAVLCVLLLQILPCTVWSIQYPGLSEAEQQALARTLYSMDIYEGCLLTQEEIKNTQQILMQREEYAWVSLNFSAGRLVAEASLRQLPPVLPQNIQTDLVAAADGLLLSINAEQGFIQKSVGQTVAKGEVLISASRPDHSGELVFSPVRGQAMARVQKTYVCNQPLLYQATVPTGQILTARTLRFAGRSFPLGSLPPEADVCAVYHTPVTLLGLALPITLEERLMLPHQEETITLTSHSARVAGLYACRCALDEEFPGAQVETESVKTEMADGVYRVEWTVGFIADIARRQGIE